jgi:hypothetical protein
VKILLDENLDRRLRTNLGAHEVFTTSYMGWEGLKNGALLSAAESAGIEVLLTGDQTLRFEQNMIRRKLAGVALSSVEWRILRDHLPRILAAIDKSTPGSFQAVDCGKFSRRRNAAGPPSFGSK